MYLGEYSSSLDDEGRMRLPEGVTSPPGSGWVLTRGFDNYLLLMPLARWIDLARGIAALPFSAADARALRRRLFSAATRLDPDPQGYIEVSTLQRQFAGLKSQVVIAGLNDYLEIWDADTWRLEQQAFSNAGANWQDLGV